MDAPALQETYIRLAVVSSGCRRPCDGEVRPEEIRMCYASGSLGAWAAGISTPA
jgi:hypothetical protein